MLAVLDAVAVAGRLTLTALGRALRGPAMQKHRIKRVDRLLGNARLQLELHAWYRHLARRLLGDRKRVIIALDWTQLSGDMYALWAAVAFRGRAIPLYAEAHPERLLSNRKVQTEFLKTLRELLPAGAQPIIVADAGFKNPFFRACQQYGFDFVVRLRGRGTAKAWCPDRLIRFQQVFRSAGARPRCLGEWHVHDSACHGVQVRLVLGRSPRKQNSRRNGHYRRAAREPWLLATSLKLDSSARIIALYETRMQIEETFRDVKDPRFGWALGLSGSRNFRRCNVLLLIASLALLAALLLGAAASDIDLQRRFQANTVRRRRVLSLFTLGRCLLLQPASHALGPPDLFKLLPLAAVVPVLERPAD